MSDKTRIITFRGLTLQEYQWNDLGAHFYSDDEPDLSGFRPYSNGGAYGLELGTKGLASLISRAQDELPDDAAPEKIARRIQSLLARDKVNTAVTDLAGGLNRYANALGQAINIPTNINVWHREAGMKQLSETLGKLGADLLTLQLHEGRREG